jgi:uncharacterized protein YbjT (DUF2867 family)
MAFTEANHQLPILVTGANGKTGRRVAQRLRALGRLVRGVSRSTEPRFDWEDRSTWPAVLQGTNAAYISFQPDLAVPGALDTVRAFFDMAVSLDVTRLVLLTGRGEVEAEDAERALQATNADWTILRASWFSQNFSENFLLEPILAGDVALPAGSAAEPFVDVDDIADVAVIALTQPGHSHQLYELTGPRALTFGEAVAEIAHASGRGVCYTSISPDEFRASLGAQLPPEWLELVIYLFTTVLDGRNTPVKDGVFRALGRAPTDFGDYVRRTAATGIWSA